MSAWIYFTVENADGTPRLVVRRNGPNIELLTRADGWVDAPELLPRFWDADYLEQTAEADARRAAEKIGMAWPADGTDAERQLDVPPAGTNGSWMDVPTLADEPRRTAD